MKPFEKSISRIRSFADDRRGNVLMMFAIFLVPTLGMVGAVIDYSRASTAARLLTDAIDSAALMAARDASKLTDAEIKTRIDGWIRANLTGEAASTFQGAQITIDRTNRIVTVGANASVTMSVTKLIGQSTLPVSAKSQSTWGTNKIELALALDNTGSMSSSGKMTALKAAALDLITIMKEASYEPDQIKVSLVPFTTQVKLATSYKDAEWLRWDMTKTTGSGSNKKTVTITKSTWEGCVTDRDQPYDVQDGDAGLTSTTMYPADFCDQT